MNPFVRIVTKLGLGLLFLFHSIKFAHKNEEKFYCAKTKSGRETSNNRRKYQSIEQEKTWTHTQKTHTKKRIKDTQHVPIFGSFFGDSLWLTMALLASIIRWYCVRYACPIVIEGMKHILLLQSMTYVYLVRLSSCH